MLSEMHEVKMGAGHSCGLLYDEIYVYHRCSSGAHAAIQGCQTACLVPWVSCGRLWKPFVGHRARRGAPVGPPCLPARPHRRASNASQVLVSPTKQLEITLVAIAVHHRC